MTEGRFTQGIVTNNFQNSILVARYAHVLAVELKVLCRHALDWPAPSACIQRRCVAPPGAVGAHAAA